MGSKSSVPSELQGLWKKTAESLTKGLRAEVISATEKVVLVEFRDGTQRKESFDRETFHDYFVRLTSKLSTKRISTTVPNVVAP